MSIEQLILDHVSSPSYRLWHKELVQLAEEQKQILYIILAVVSVQLVLFVIKWITDRRKKKGE